jgi:tetratricopeptide (TPR) repeat protein
MRKPLVRAGSAAIAGLALAACAAVFACSHAEEKQAKPPAPAAAAPAARVAESPSSTKTARVLALSEIRGATPVDVQLRAAQEMCKKLPDIRDHWIALGRLWVRKARESADPGFYLNAKACADVSLEIEPGNRPGTDLVGLVLINSHKFREGLDLADELLARAPDDVMALGTRSDALLELGRYDEAVDAAQKMLDYKPNLPSYTRASYLQWLTGDAKRAKATAWKGIDSGRDLRDPEPIAWAIVQAAFLFWHDGDYRGASAGFDKALEAFKEYPPALVGKGKHALLVEGDAPRAAALFARAYKLSPLVETAWLLGDARAAAGDAQGAEEAYAHVVKDGRATDPRTLALFYATKDREHDEAVKLALTEKKVRDDIYTEDVLAWALYRAGRVDEAKEAAKKATALGTRDARLWYHAGAIRIAAGEKAAGEKLVRAALELDPKFDAAGAAEAAKLVAE